MGLFDGLLGGGAGSADDPYADILTPAQRNQMQVQGLLAMAGAFAQAGMPSRLPVPFGSALGSAAAALGTGQEAGMKTAIENALAAQKVRDLRNTSEFRKKLLGDVDPTSPLGRAIAVINAPGGTAAPAGPSSAGATPSAGTYATPGASPAAPAAGGLLMMDRSLLYPDAAAGGLLGPGDGGAEGEYGGGQKVGGLLGPGPAASVARMPTPLAIAAPAASRAALSQDASAAEVARLDAEYAAKNPQASAAAKASMHVENVIAANRLPTERGGSSTAPAEPDPGAGGDTPWGPTFAQGGAAGAPARGGGQTYWTPAGLAALQPTEGRYDQIHYPSGNPSTATGGFGFLDRTWREQAPKAGVDLAQYPRAYMAPPAVQDAVAAITPVGHWTGVDAQGRPFNANAQRLAANPAFVSGEPVAGPTAGGGEDAGWGPTFAQGAAEPRMPATTGGPDRVIPSGAGGAPAATLAQYAPGATGAPPAAGMTGGPPLYPSAAPAGNQAAAISTLILELARRNAAAEVLGLGNPYGSLLTVLQGSPQYKAQVEAATEQAKRTVGLGFIKEEKRLGAEGELPSLITRDVNKGVIDQLNKQIEQMGAAALNPAGTLLVNGANGPVEKQVNQLQRATAQAGFDVPEIGFKGMNGPAPAGQIPGLPGTSLPGAPGGPGATGAPGPGPQAQGVTPGGPGTLYDKPVLPPLTPQQTKLQEAIAGQDAEARAKALSAVQSLRGIDDARQQLAQGIYSGTGADLKLSLAKWGTALGWPNAKVANTENYVIERAQEVMNILSSKSFGSGAGISNNDRIFVEKMAAGNTALDLESIKRVLDVSEKLHKNMIQRWNDVAPTADLKIQPPPSRAPPSGAVYKGQTSTCFPAYTMPDGSVKVIE